MPVLVLILLLVLLAIGFSLAWHLIGLAIMLLMAAFIAYLASSLVQGRVPYGWLALCVIGLIGEWIGLTLFGHIGPPIFGVQVIPAFLGAVILTFIISLLSGQRGRRFY